MEYVAIAFVLTKVNFEMEEKNTGDSWHDLFPNRHADTTHKEIMNAILLLFTSTCT